jgi:hypothetical protein
MKKQEVNHNGAKHAFFYLTSFFTLGLTAIAVGALCYQIINFYFPLEYQDYGNQLSQSAIKFGIATIIVAAPVFYFVTRIINRSLSKKDLDHDSGIRRWLTYIVLFIAAATVVGDLVTIIWNFLEGELSIRFFLKALTILIIAGGIFLYYFGDMRNETDASRRKKNNLWSIIFAAILTIPFVWALFIMESPMVTRAKKIDRETVRSLNYVRMEVDEFYRRNDELPSSIEALEAFDPSDIRGLTSLQTEKNFEYRQNGEKEYALCADFERNNQDDTENPYDYYNIEWRHDAGNFCFELTAAEPDIKPTLLMD